MGTDQRMARIVGPVAAAALLIAAFACNGGEDALRTATPTPSPAATPQAISYTFAQSRAAIKRRTVTTALFVLRRALLAR